MSRFVLIRFSSEVAESEFRTQPVATAVSATGGVNTTPSCTRADAHFSRAHLTVHNSYRTALFQCCHTALAQGTQESVSRIFFCTHSHLVCHVIVERSVCPLPSGPVLIYMLCVKNLSDLNLVWWQWTNLCASAHWSGMSGCLANPTPNTDHGR